ncbi:MAG TPA: nuclear transport factor 2 family protein [Burkholderiales bacterium]|jgi:ketosteroid isomerase-like protein
MTLSSSERAEAAFYSAFEKADLGAMMAVWAEDEEILCIHPGGQRLVGMDAVRESWRALFAPGPHMRFRLLDVRVQSGRMLAVHNLYERISVVGQRKAHLALATNVYVLTPSGWRMLVHHASPLPPDAAAPDAPVGTLH